MRRRTNRKNYIKTLALRRRIYVELKSIGINSIDSKPLSGTKNQDLFRVYSEHFDVNETNFKVFRKTFKLNKPNERVVYFIGNTEEGCVKIGYSNNVEKRLGQLKTGCPFPIRILCIIPSESPVTLESTLHGKYKKYRLHGEWFKIEGKLKERLERLELPSDGS